MRPTVYSQVKSVSVSLEQSGTNRGALSTSALYSTNKNRITFGMTNAINPSESKMPKILFLSDNFPPEVNAPASRTMDHCREWVKQGADVTVITGFPNFPRGRVLGGYRNQLFKEESMDGIRVLRVWTYIAANKGFVKRILDYLSFALASFVAGMFVKADIIVATSPQFFTTWSGFFLSGIKQIPWVFELRDIWPESIKSVGAMKSSLGIRLLEKIELALYRDAKGIVAVTHSFKKNLSRRGISPEKIEVITNGVDLSLFTPEDHIEKGWEIRNRLGLADKFILGYMGTHGMAHGLDFILRMAKQASDQTLHFLFIGDGAKKNELVELARTLQLTNVTFLEPVPKNEISDYLASIDVALVPLKKSDTFKEVIPSKIFECAAMRKPILLGVDGEAREIIERYQCGLFFEPESSSSFLECLKQIRSPEVYASLLPGADQLAREYDRTHLATRMLELLKMLAH